MSEKSSRPKRQPNPVGRPSTYNAKLHPKLVKVLTRQGFTNEQIAEELEISIAALYNWYNEHPELLEANAKGKPDIDLQVQDSLLSRALKGYKVTEVVKDGKGNIIKTVEKELPPDTTAALKWLFNRRPAEWRERREEQPPNDVSPLAINFNGDTDPDLMDPEKQDNLEIGEGQKSE